ncbi:MAG: cobalamin biosynthesis protein CobD [Deltaproteobacteria bacterium]|nr:cobalamin biosynthesis protein CobD [Deltaproteobacteria bacterium]MCL4874383.1 cobalamin biosynthesis protein CobD [bacterium]
MTGPEALEGVLDIVPLSAFAFLTALFLDLLIGDPERAPHPVRWIGRLAAFLEAPIRKALPKSAGWERLGGALLWVLVVGGAYAATALVLHYASLHSTALSFALSVFFIWAGLSMKTLGDEALAVARALGHGLDEGRRRLCRIVGRDTGNLKEEEVLKAAVETVAENASDGVIAPLFFLVLGGPALMMAYKAVNTLDSMVGYRNERYRHFGWFSARMDDAANFMPARLSGALIVTASFILGYNWMKSAAMLARDGRNHPSPNSGVPEAAMAGALGVRLGGGSFYGGVFSGKPWIGDPVNGLEAGTVLSSVRIMRAAGLVMAGTVIMIMLLFN